jgi:hypothetical protein
MKKLFALSILLINLIENSHAQGCVAVRSGGAVCTRAQADSLNKGYWQLNLNYRYFKSFRHYVGTTEQKERVENETDVRNWSHSVNITLLRQLNLRWSVLVDIPVISNIRSSKYEHYGNTSTNPNARRSTRSFGLGDIRIAANYWLLNPLTAHRGNLQLGTGIKFATGDYRYQDYFWRNDTTAILGPVDQSIQLGDGGTGITMEANGYYNFTPQWGIYGNLYYLINPREQNGTSTARGGTPTATALKYTTSSMSVPDQYLARIGANLTKGAFNASAGLRLEGIPSSDLIGGDKGFRRPGYIISAEPGISYMTAKANFFATVPVALVRNRTKSYADKLRTSAEGIEVHGDAAFADYLINIGMNFHF